MSFLPAYLIENKGFSEFYAGVALTILTTSGIIIKPFMGTISDRIDKKILMLSITILSMITTFFIVWFNSMNIIFILLFLLAFSSGIFLVFSSYLMDQWGEKGRAGKLGFYRSLILLFGSPIAAIIGITASKYGFNAPFYGISLFLFIVVIILLFNIISERHKFHKLNRYYK
jgi:DHA1 family quinolone resistance protein-like MFS transporter